MPDGLTVTADRNDISRLQVLFLKQGIDRISKKSPELSIKLSKLRKCKLLALANIQYSLFQRYRGSLLFVSYEICLALSLGYAATRHQAIEVGMVNYLWPSLTILFAILFNGQKTNWLIVPGLLLALVGVCWVLGGDNGLHYDEIINNITTSPLSYFLAFIGAFIWAVYCTVTNKYARGFNGITVFVLLTGASLWVYYFLTPQPEMVFSTPVMIKLISAAFTLGFAYAAWNVGILHGNVTIMAVGSYFTPVLSSALAAVLLSAPLSFSFWQGALMVCGGSLLCWLATRRG